jgi:hypothetical protein
MLLAPAAPIAAALQWLLLVASWWLLFLRPRTLPTVGDRLLLLQKRLLCRWLAVCRALAVRIRVGLLPLRLLVVTRGI